MLSPYEEAVHPVNLYYYFCLLIVIIVSQVVGIYLWYAIFSPKILDAFLLTFFMFFYFFTYIKRLLFFYIGKKVKDIKDVKKRPKFWGGK